MAEDRYATFDYARLIDWPTRLKREWPFLDAILRSAPSRDVLDLGSGTGEHARLLASHGFEVVGVDSSQAMVDKSRAVPADRVRFVLGDFLDVPTLVDRRFGAAMCVGNALPHLTGEQDLSRLTAALRRVLLPDAPVIFQMVNYERFAPKGEGALPLSILPDAENPKAKIIFMRTVELLPDGRAIFMPSTLRQRSDLDPPIELLGSRRVEIRAWRRAQLESALHDSGFPSVEVWGSYGREPFDPKESRDLIVVAR